MRLLSFLSRVRATARHQRVGATVRAMLAVGLPFFGMCLIAGFSSIFSQISEANQAYTARSEGAARLYAEVLAAPLARGDDAAVRAAAEPLARGELLALEIVDARGRVVHAVHRPAPDVLDQGPFARAVGGTRSYQLKVTHHGAAVGTLHVAFFKDGRTHTWRVRPEILIVLGTGAPIVVMFVGMLVARRFARRHIQLLTSVRGTAAALEEATASLRQVVEQQSTAGSSARAAVGHTQSVATEVRAAAASTAERAQSLDEVKRRSEAEAAAAIDAVTGAREAMRAVHEQAQASGAAIQGFSEKARAVGEIASTVAGLAERSNVLALNAAIEASRAGERGRAFAVVSREVRALAEATNRAAARVKQLVGDVHQAIASWTASSAEGDHRLAASVSAAQAALESFRAFGEATQRLATIARDVSAAGQRQHQAIDDTVEALEEASGATEGQGRGIQEVGTSGARLAEISRGLVELLRANAKIDVRGEGTALRTRLSTLIWRIVPVSVPVAVLCFGVCAAGYLMGQPVEALARRDALERSAHLRQAVAAAVHDPDRATLASLLGTALEQHRARYLVLRDGTGVLAAAGGVAGEVAADATGVLVGDTFALGMPVEGSTARLSMGFRPDEARASKARSLRIAITIAVATFLFGTLTAFLVARRHARTFEVLLRRVDAAALSMDALISGLAASIAQQSAAIAQADAALQSTRSSAIEVGRGAQKAADRAVELIDGASACGEGARLATAAMSSARPKITELREHVAGLFDAISGFALRADEIGSVATTVSQLADRSESLAVNAAIEAARTAGAGGGFGVVAEEMRALADGSARAALQVREIIADVRGALQRALENAREGERRVRAAEALAEGATQRVERFAEVARDFAQVGHALGASARSQAAGIEQMVAAISQIADSSEVQRTGIATLEETARRLVTLSRGLLEAASTSASLNEGRALQAQGGPGVALA